MAAVAIRPLLEDFQIDRQDYGFSGGPFPVLTRNLSSYSCTLPRLMYPVIVLVHYFQDVKTHMNQLRLCCL